MNSLNEMHDFLETDLICVCANCHRMLHRFKNYIAPVEELKYNVDDDEWLLLCKEGYNGKIGFWKKRTGSL